MHKKSQGLPINVIILTTLGLVVLIVMVLIFTGQIRIFTKNLSCEAREGKCMADTIGDTKKCLQDSPIIIYTQDCKLVKDGKLKQPEERPGQCCIPLG